MTLNDKASTAWSNLGRRKVRTALTAVGVVVGILTVVTMVSLVNGVQVQVNKQFEKIGLDRVAVRPVVDGGGGGFNPFSFGERTKLITAADLKRWKSWPQVQQAIPEIDLPMNAATRLNFGGDSKLVRVIGGSSSRRSPFSDPLEAVAGTIDIPEKHGSIVLSKGILRRLKIKESDFKTVLGKSAEVVLLAPRGEKQSYQFKVIGVSSDGRSSVQLSALDRLTMKEWWFDDKELLKNQGYDSVTLRAANVTGAKALVEKLRKEKFEVQSIDAILDVANRIFTVITTMLALASSIALFVACIGIVNTMIMSIYERTREIGTLKAMGASRSDIRQMFMIEAGLIGLMGGAVGLISSWIMGRGLNHLATWYARHRELPLPENLFIITPGLAFGSLLFALSIGITAGLYPANRAARLDPLTALRHE